VNFNFAPPAIAPVQAAAKARAFCCSFAIFERITVPCCEFSADRHHIENAFDTRHLYVFGSGSSLLLLIGVAFMSAENPIAAAAAYG
jgi:hypothetical protein